jgi:hypothetical protein
MKKLTKTQLRKIANMHSAAVILATESTFAFNSLHDDEIAILDDEFARIATNLLYGEKPIFNANDIVEFVRNNRKQMKSIENCKSISCLPKEGMKVRIKEKIEVNENCRGFLVLPKHLDVRRPNEVGEYIGYVPGAGGDLWWIKHKDGTVGAYSTDELTDV